MSSGSTEVLGKIVVVRDVSITSFDEKLQHQSTFLEPTQTCERENLCTYGRVVTHAQSVIELSARHIVHVFVMTLFMVIKSNYQAATYFRTPALLSCTLQQLLPIGSTQLMDHKNLIMKALRPVSQRARTLQTQNSDIHAHKNIHVILL